MAERIANEVASQVLRVGDLPLIGSSRHFVGRDHGHAPVSLYFVNMQPGRGTPLHCHPYDEIILVQSGTSLVVIGDDVQEAVAGTVLVVKAGMPHGFIAAGPEPLTQIDIHASEVFAQTNLPPTAASRRAGLPE